LHFYSAEADKVGMESDDAQVTTNSIGPEQHHDGGRRDGVTPKSCKFTPGERKKARYEDKLCSTRVGATNTGVVVGRMVQTGERVLTDAFANARDKSLVTGRKRCATGCETDPSAGKHVCGVCHFITATAPNVQ